MTTNVETRAETGPERALTLRRRPDGVAVVVYDLPGESVNTLRADFADEFCRVLGEVEGDAAILGAVLVSGKPGGFIAGADISMLKAVRTATEAEAICRAGHVALARLEACKKPVVAAVHGAALGGGFEVALACRARVLSDDKKTLLGLPEVQLGLLPGLSGLQRLARLAGLQVALDHGLTGKNMRPKKAKALGVVSDVVPAAILEDVAARLALDLARPRPPAPAKKSPLKALLGNLDPATLGRAALEDNPLGRALLFRKAREGVLKKTGGHYPAPERILDVLKAYAERGFEASQEVEAKAFGELVVSSVAARLMEIFFAQTALKKDTGVDEPGVAARETKRIAMLGAGLMGAGIAYVSANAGYQVRLKDRSPEDLARGLKYVAEILEGRVKKGQMTRQERDELFARLTATTDYSGLASADVVIEAVFEDLDLKHRILREVEEACHERTIFASNTSSIPISKIAEASRRPENVVGMHYFSPVHKMPLLEVIRTPKTSPEVVATAVAIGKRQGKTVIVVGDGVGFYTSRVLGPYMNEASYLLMEGASVEQIDRALVVWGFPVGPFQLLDEVGIDVAAHVGPIMQEAFGERIVPPATMAKLVSDGRKGRKNEKGFYLYGKAAKAKGKGKRVDESVYGALGLPLPDPKSKPKVASEEIQMRCALQFVNEAFHCLGEGILRSARDGDIGAVFGLGFPPFRGGPFRYVDATGAAEVLRRIQGYERRFGKRWAPAPALVEAAKGERRIFG